MMIFRGKLRTVLSFCLSLLLLISVLLVPGTAVVASAYAGAALSLSMEKTNSWEEDGKTNTQYALTIKNTGDKAASGWTIAIPVPEGSSIAEGNSWNGTFSISETALTITPADYNREIPAGGEARDIGFIISTKDKADLSGSVSVGSSKTESTDPEDTDDVPDVDISTIPSGDDWLHTDGSKILDANGTEVWITGVNWFGYNTGSNVFDGVWAVNMKDAIASIADHGFNLLRIPMSAELVLAWKNGEYPQANFNQAENADLVGMTSLEIFDLALATCKANGIKVMLDIHSAETNSAGHMTNLWYTDKISAEQFLESLVYLADRYKDDDTVIAFDLKNEPHGKPNEAGAIWNDSSDPDNWKAVAEKAGNAVLDLNPNVLIMIEGIEIYPKDIAKNGDFSSQDSADYFFNWWGGNLRGVRDYPIDFGTPERNAQIVYSPHDYGPAVFDQPWFSGDYTYESLQEDCWNDNWFFIQKENIAPLLIGEWGGFMTEPNVTWMTYLRKFIKENRINHTFWCFNANSGDTGGLVKDDFRTWDEEKYDFVKEVLWQEDGRFIGLDHVVPLGSSGMGASLGSISGEVNATDPTAVSTTDAQSSSDTTTLSDTDATAAGSDTSKVTSVTSNTSPTVKGESVSFMGAALVGVAATVLVFAVIIVIFVLVGRSRKDK